MRRISNGFNDHATKQEVPSYIRSLCETGQLLVKAGTKNVLRWTSEYNAE